jgi:hypothetical protein
MTRLQTMTAGRMLQGKYRAGRKRKLQTDPEPHAGISGIWSMNILPKFDSTVPPDQNSACVGTTQGAEMEKSVFPNNRERATARLREIAEEAIKALEPEQLNTLAFTMAAHVSPQRAGEVSDEMKVESVEAKTGTAEHNGTEEEPPLSRLKRVSIVEEYEEDPPEWVEKTPDECTYNLTMFETRGGEIQNIDVTRDEYIALKRHLATMRGFDVPEPKDE